MDLTGVVALVTGGAHRVGRALVLALAEQGCDIALHFGTSADAAARTAQEVRDMGRRVALLEADLRDPEMSEVIIKRATEQLGPVQVLVNSAAQFPDDTLLDVTLQQWDQTLRVNLASPVFLIQAFARALPDDVPGAVLNVSDWKTQRPYRQHFSYMIAKAGLDAATRAAAVALGPRVRVNAVALGAILPPPGQGPEYLERLTAGIPLARPGSPDAVAQAAVALISNDYVTGEVLAVAGGAPLV